MSIREELTVNIVRFVSRFCDWATIGGIPERSKRDYEEVDMCLTLKAVLVITAEKNDTSVEQALADLINDCMMADSGAPEHVNGMELVRIIDNKFNN